MRRPGGAVPTEPVPAPVLAPPVVALAGVSRSYPGEPPVAALADVDLMVAGGEYITVVGRSGSGKSTLLHILGLLDRPTAGTYRFCGADVSGLDDAARTAHRRGRIGFVFQAFHLLAHRSARENVMLSLLHSDGSRRQRAAAAAEALERVGLGHRMDFRPTQLSGGERQRVAIARAIVGGPELLLADEPTGNLDSATSQDILALFDNLHREGLTLVVITHDPAVAGRGGRTVVIADGRLAPVVSAA